MVSIALENIVYGANRRDRWADAAIISMIVAGSEACDAAEEHFGFPPEGSDRGDRHGHGAIRRRLID